MIYDSLSTYIATSRGENIEMIRLYKIARAAMIVGTMTKAIDMGDVVEYSIEDGQSVIRAKHRSPEDVMKSIKAIDNMIKYLETEINGRSAQMVDGKNLNGGIFYGY